MQFLADNEPGFVLSNIKDEDGDDLKATVVDTLMRVDLNQPLRPDKVPN